MDAAHMNAYAAATEITIRVVTMEAPWRWLTCAWQQIWQAPRIALFYGILFSAISAGLFSLLLIGDMLPLFLPLVGGFLLLGPLLAVGLYETARRLLNDEPISLRAVLLVKTASPSQIAFIGVCLLLAYFAWIRIAMLRSLFFAGIDAAFPPPDIFFAELFTSADGLALLLSGSIAGSLIAFIIFSLSAMSIPLAMDREVDAVTAMLASLEAVKKNFAPMLLWGWLIALLIGIGIATAFVGLAITFPLVGLATWHGYKEVMSED